VAKHDAADRELSNDELRAELQRLRDTTRIGDLERLVQELAAREEELRVQQTQLLESQVALEEARDRYTLLFDFAPVGYLVLDGSGMIREANLSAAALLGVERGRLAGAPLFLHVVERDRRVVLDHLAQCRRGAARVESEVTIRSPRGPQTPVQLTSTPAVRGHRDRFSTAVIDLSERQRLEEERARGREEQQRIRHEEQLARAASEAKDRFLAVLSHELRTPLTPILLALDTLRQHALLPAALRPTLEMIRRNVLLETRLIDDLLDVTRITQGKMTYAPEIVDLHELVHETIGLCHPEPDSGLEMRTKLAAEAHHVHADPVRLRQVLWNLLHNAIRNTPAQGWVAISTMNDASGSIALTVADSGRGIDAALLPNIFKLFEQGEDMRRRGMGLGLGLPISKSIVEAHGGRISAESNGPGSGACFTVQLHTVSEPRALEVTPEVPRPAHPSRTVLLVEDNEDSATALATILELHGYVVRVAKSVQEALELAEHADIMISDIGLPDGTGYELMRAISSRRRIPAIALSGYGSNEDMQRSAEAGFELHIVKPVEPNRLLDALERLATR